MAAYPRIPYGEADIRRIRLRDWLYVDKTRFLRRLEEESYAFLTRPRRFGKSLWVSVLENYYDRTRAEDWPAVFDGTDIGRDPTEDRLRLRHPALQLLRLRRHAGDAARALRGLLRHGDPQRPGAQRGPLSRRSDPPDPRAPRRRRQARRAVRVHRPPRRSAVRADRRVRQLRQYRAGPPRRGGLRVVDPRRRLLPQLLRDPEGGRRGERRRARAAVHHRRLAHHDGRCDPAASTSART